MLLIFVAAVRITAGTIRIPTPLCVTVLVRVPHPRFLGVLAQKAYDINANFLQKLTMAHSLVCNLWRIAYDTTCIRETTLRLCARFL